MGIATHCHIGDVLAVTGFVMPAVEVIDSHCENFRFDLVSVIADNSSSRFMLGGQCIKLGNPFDCIDILIRIGSG
jgi:2-keto-4-pentenoate hydratase